MREEIRVKDSIERKKKLKEVIKTNAVNTNEKDKDAAEESVQPAFFFRTIINFRLYHDF